LRQGPVLYFGEGTAKRLRYTRVKRGKNPNSASEGRECFQSSGEPSLGVGVEEGEVPDHPAFRDIELHSRGEIESMHIAGDLELVNI